MTDRPFDPHRPPHRTRDGRPARIIGTDREDPEGFVIVALVSQEDGYEAVLTYQRDGRYSANGGKNPVDLVNVPERHSRWQNFYRIDDIVWPGTTLYPTKEKADEDARWGKHFAHRIACLRIEFEEGEGL